jgi:hypothetical protein
MVLLSSFVGKEFRDGKPVDPLIRCCASQFLLRGEGGHVHSGGVGG